MKKIVSIMLVLVMVLSLAACGGKGEIKTEMAFLDPVTRPCETCGGRRLKKESLAVTVGGINIYDLTCMSVKKLQEYLQCKMLRITALKLWAFHFLCNT